MNEEQQTRQAIQVINIQMETLAQLEVVKTFLELDQKRNLLIKTLPQEDNKEGDQE